MSSDKLISALERLAGRKGVLVRYQDGFRRQRSASPDSLVAILRELGAPLESVADAGHALFETDLARWRTLAAPVCVTWDDDGIRLALRLPEAGAAKTVEWSLQLETGEERSGQLAIADLPNTRRVEIGRERFQAKTLRLPQALPAGYHQLRLKAGAQSAVVTVLAAPSRCWQSEAANRSWGTFLPLYAMHSEQSWGAGSFSDLGRLFDWVKGLGGSFVGTLPLLAAYLSEPFEYSPYVPASRLFWNEFYVDPRRLPEWDGSTGAHAALDSARTSGELAAFRSEPLIDYHRQAAMRGGILNELAAAAFANPDRRAELEGFAFERPHLNEYATYRAALTKLGSAAIRERTPGSLGLDDYDAGVRQQHVYAQWAADAQLTQLAEQAGQPGLYLDLPLGVHPDSYDVWRNAHCYANGSSGGAPPDRFFTKGQNWGFAPLHPMGLRQDGYGHLGDIVRSHLRYAGILRIDHFMWLHRLYWIPQGAAASEGTYVQYPAEEIYAVLCIESKRSHSMVVGEDLGTVPDYVRGRMKQHGIDRMYVAQFSFYGNAEKPLTDPPEDVLASVNTHDTPSWNSFWNATEVDDQVSMDLLTEQEANDERRNRAELRGTVGWAYQTEQTAEAILPKVLEQMAKSDARAVLVNLEDLWGEPSPQNTPGTGPERPNWKRRAKLSLEEMQQDDTVVGALRAVDADRKR
ncbi:MAG: 4-alpha-glucanotransferase [Acidobacteria bacterium]|nr:4-alpha-glucanotransferase [Acidobacteriota bacterium]MDA1233415.1 4-alpha-glucanotransferase [Acidobacteriota bacterium]